MILQSLSPWQLAWNIAAPVDAGERDQARRIQRLHGHLVICTAPSADTAERTRRAPEGWKSWI